MPAVAAITPTVSAARAAATAVTMVVRRMRTPSRSGCAADSPVPHDRFGRGRMPPWASRPRSSTRGLSAPPMASARLPLPPLDDWETFPFEGDIRLRPLWPAGRRAATPRRGPCRLLAMPAGRGGRDLERRALAPDAAREAERASRDRHPPAAGALRPRRPALPSRRRARAARSSGSSAPSTRWGTSGGFTSVAGETAAPTSTGGSSPDRPGCRSFGRALPRSGTTSSRPSPRTCGAPTSPPPRPRDGRGRRPGARLERRGSCYR